MCGSCGKSSNGFNRGGFGKIKKGQKVKGLRKKTFKQLKDEITRRVEKSG